MYNKICCLEDKFGCPGAKEELAKPVCNFDEVKEDKLQENKYSKQIKKRPDLLTCGFLKDTATSAGNRSLTQQQKVAKKQRLQKPWWHCAEMRASCTKCPNKKVPPKPREPQSCPDPFQHAYHHLPRIRNYLLLEDNRLYCHQIFNKTVNPLKHVYTEKGLCRGQINLEECRERAQKRMESVLASWVEDNHKRNTAYASNPISAFYSTSPIHPNSTGNYHRKKSFSAPTCNLASQLF